MGTARRTLDFPLQSELIEESVEEQQEGPWTFLYSQNSSSNLFWGSARRTLDFPLELVEEPVGDQREGAWNFLYKNVLFFDDF